MFDASFQLRHRFVCLEDPREGLVPIEARPHEDYKRELLLIKSGATRNNESLPPESAVRHLFGIDEARFVDTSTSHKSLRKAIGFAKQLPKDTASVNRIGHADDFMSIFAGVRIEHATPGWSEVIWIVDIEGCNVELELVTILLAPLTTL